MRPRPRAWVWLASRAALLGVAGLGVAGLGVAGLGVAGLGVAGSRATPVAAAGSAFVSIVDYGYSPASITVPPGTTVTWTYVRNGQSMHSVTSDQTGGFDSSPFCPTSGCLRPGDSYSHTFGSVGSFRYHCRVHPDLMHGTVVVQSGTPTTSPSSSTSAPRSSTTSVSSSTRSTTTPGTTPTSGASTSTTSVSLPPGPPLTLGSPESTGPATTLAAAPTAKKNTSSGARVALLITIAVLLVLAAGWAVWALRRRPA